MEVEDEGQKASADEESLTLGAARAGGAAAKLERG
jgi:hypothetical protein